MFGKENCCWCVLQQEGYCFLIPSLPRSSPRPTSHHTPTTSPPFSSLLFYKDPTWIVFNQSGCLLCFAAAFCYRTRKHHLLRVAHTAELDFVLHDRKLGFHNPLSNTTFHRLLLSAHFPFSQSIPSPSVSPARTMPVPWAAPVLCAGPELLHGCPARVYFKTTSVFLHGYRG